MLKIADVIEIVRKKYMVEVSMNKAYWVRRKALEKLNERYDEQYSKLWGYSAKLIRANPGIIVKVLCDRVTIEEQPLFLRYYMCFGSVKKGFLVAYRPIISLDRCHLKDMYGANFKRSKRSIFPPLCSIIKSETKDTKSWFLDLLLLNIRRKGWVFISDQQKVIICLVLVIYMLWCTFMVIANYMLTLFIY